MKSPRERFEELLAHVRTTLGSVAGAAISINYVLTLMRDCYELGVAAGRLEALEAIKNLPTRT